MRIAGWVLTAMLLLAAFYGCAGRSRSTAPPPGSWVMTEEGVFTGDQSKIWEAVVESLADFRVEQRDQAAGTVVTGWKTTLEHRDALAVLRPRRTEDMGDIRDSKPPLLRINFEVKRRMIAALVDLEEGKTRVSLTRHLSVTCFDSPAGTMKSDTFRLLVQEEFDREDELRAIMQDIRRCLGD